MISIPAGMIVYWVKWSKIMAYTISSNFFSFCVKQLFKNPLDQSSHFSFYPYVKSFWQSPSLLRVQQSLLLTTSWHIISIHIINSQHPCPNLKFVLPLFKLHPVFSSHHTLPIYVFVNISQTASPSHIRWFVPGLWLLLIM